MPYPLWPMGKCIEGCGVSVCALCMAHNAVDEKNEYEMGKRKHKKKNNMKCSHERDGKACAVTS